jgi:hypothetical protein
LEGGTKDEIWIFEALFKGVSTQLGPRSIEKCFENPDFIFCSSFQNLRLGAIKLFILPKSSFGEHKLVHLMYELFLFYPNEDFGRMNKR